MWNERAGIAVRDANAGCCVAFLGGGGGFLLAMHNIAAESFVYICGTADALLGFELAIRFRTEAENLSGLCKGEV